jgi:hypothetical protein
MNGVISVALIKCFKNTTSFEVVGLLLLSIFNFWIIIFLYLPVLMLFCNHHWIHWLLQLLSLVSYCLTVILFLLSYDTIVFLRLLLLLLKLLLRIKSCGKRVILLMVEHWLLLNSLLEVVAASWCRIFVWHRAIFVRFFKYHIIRMHEIIFLFKTFFLYGIIIRLLNHWLSLQNLCVPSIHLIHLFLLLFIIKERLSFHCKAVKLLQIL